MLILKDAQKLLGLWIVTTLPTSCITLVNSCLMIDWNLIIMAMPAPGFELGSPSPKEFMLPTELTLQDNQTCLLCIRFLQRCCVPDFCNFLKIFDLNDTIVLNGLVLR